MDMASSSPWWWWWWCYFLLLLSVPVATLVLLPSSETDALLAFKANVIPLPGSRDQTLSTWQNSTEPCTTWHGVSCDTDAEGMSYVVGLILPGKLGGGTITQSIGKLTQLRSLRLNKNSLTGTIPPQLSELSYLRTLDLSSNNLTGMLPWNLGDLSRLRSLVLSTNRFYGKMPISIDKLHRLRYLYMDGNKLAGFLPTSLASLSRLKELSLRSNYLTGTIPTELTLLATLVSLDLSNNHLNGTIPNELGAIPNLTKLNLSNNDLIGLIPSSLSRFPATVFSGNKLCGPPLASCPSSSSSSSPKKGNSSGSVPPKESSYGDGDGGRSKIIVGAVVGGTGLIILAALLVLFLFLRGRKAARRGPSPMEAGPAHNWFDPRIPKTGRMTMFGDLSIAFKWSYDDLVSGAGYFDTAHILGKGRFATVYRSSLPDGVALAVKVFKLNSLPPPPDSSFEHALEKLSLLTHRNLLPLHGFYSSPAEKAIFYDLMPNRSLYDTLHYQALSHPTPSPSPTSTTPTPTPTAPTLDWSRRQLIALGTTQALLFLHKRSKQLHMDVKSTNILLDEDMAPRLGDFGLLGLISTVHAQDIVTGYEAPELQSAPDNKHTEKTDIYGLGVVLLELITGKQPVLKANDVNNHNVSLVIWATQLHSKGRGREAIDQSIAMYGPPIEHLEIALDLAIHCVNSIPAQRPTLFDIISILESLATQPPSVLPSPELVKRPLIN